MLKKLFIASLMVIFVVASLGSMNVSAQEQINCGDYYKVQSGDWLSRIAVKCDVPVQRIIKLNPQIENINLLYPGQTIYLTEEAIPEIPVTGDDSISMELYTVQPGDTLSEIAARHQLSVSELLAANPSIDSKNIIYTGQLLYVPQESIYTPVVHVTPAEVMETGSVNLLATGFPPNDTVEVAFGPVESEYTLLFKSTTDAYGRVSSVIPVPAWAELDKSYVFVVYEKDNHAFKAVSDDITFYQAGQQPVEAGQYVVQSGDTLSEIAVLFGTDVETLLELNPQIIDPSIIYRGQVIQLPQGINPLIPWMNVSDLTPIASQNLNVYANNFPPNVNVDIRISRQGEPDAAAVVDARSNDQGEVSGSIQVPDYAERGELWEVKIMTTELTDGVQVTSPALTIVQ